MKGRSLFASVVNRGQAEQILTEIRAFGVSGGLVLHGEGTRENKTLRFLGLEETKKEVIFIEIPSEFAPSFHAMLRERFNMEKKNRGIAFTIPLASARGEAYLPPSTRFAPTGFSYVCFFVVVDHGRAADAVSCARTLGLRGGTIIEGRGAGEKLKNSAFPIEITPEKDIVFIVAPREAMDDLRKALVEDLDLDKPGTGILFILPVTGVTGLYAAAERRMER